MFVSVWSVVGSGFIAAVLVTGVVYLIGADGLLKSKERRRISSSSSSYYYPDPYQYQYHQQYGQDRWGRRQDGFIHQMEKILSFLSVEAMQVSVEKNGSKQDPKSIDAIDSGINNNNNNLFLEFSCYKQDQGSIDALTSNI